MELLEAHGALRDLEEQALADLELELGALTSERAEILRDHADAQFADLNGKLSMARRRSLMDNQSRLQAPSRATSRLSMHTTMIYTYLIICYSLPQCALADNNKQLDALGKTLLTGNPSAERARHAELLWQNAVLYAERNRRENRRENRSPVMNHRRAMNRR